MTSEIDYGEIVKQAEAAVASIKDGELKGIAFGKILDTLLGKGGHAGEHVSGSSRQPHAGGQRGRKAAPTTRPAKKKSGPKAYVEELIDDGFFKTPRTLAAIRAELGNGGHHIPVTSLSGPMIDLCKERRLRRQKAKDGKKQIYTYSHW